MTSIVILEHSLSDLKSSTHSLVGGCSMIVQNYCLANFRNSISRVRTKNVNELACLIFMLHIWLWVGGLRTWGRYGILVWNIGGDRRHTPTIVPTTHQIHYPVTTKNTFRKVLNVKIVHAEQGAFCPPKNFPGTFSPWHPFFTVVQSPNIVCLGVCDILSLVCLD